MFLFPVTDRGALWLTAVSSREQRRRPGNIYHISLCLNIVNQFNSWIKQSSHRERVLWAKYWISADFIASYSCRFTRLPGSFLMCHLSLLTVFSGILHCSAWAEFKEDAVEHSVLTSRMTLDRKEYSLPWS